MPVDVGELASELPTMVSSSWDFMFTRVLFVSLFCLPVLVGRVSCSECSPSWKCHGVHLSRPPFNL